MGLFEWFLHHRWARKQQNLTSTVLKTAFSSVFPPFFSNLTIFTKNVFFFLSSRVRVAVAVTVYYSHLCMWCIEYTQIYSILLIIFSELSSLLSSPVFFYHHVYRLGSSYYIAEAGNSSFSVFFSSLRFFFPSPQPSLFSLPPVSSHTQ